VKAENSPFTIDNSQLIIKKKQLVKYKQVKQGLMQVLLTGKIRIVNGK